MLIQWCQQQQRCCKQQQQERCQQKQQQRQRKQQHQEQQPYVHKFMWYCTLKTQQKEITVVVEYMTNVLRHGFSMISPLFRIKFQGSRLIRTHTFDLCFLVTLVIVCSNFLEL